MKLACIFGAGIGIALVLDAPHSIAALAIVAVAALLHMEKP